AAHVANGADILTGTAQMVVGPIAVAQESGLKWFGTQSSQAELAAESGMLFQLYKWEVVLRDIIANIGEGILGGEAYTINLEKEGLVIEISEFAGLEEAAVAELQAIVDGYIEQIVSGEIVVLPELDTVPEATEAAG